MYDVRIVCSEIWANMLYVSSCAYDVPVIAQDAVTGHYAPIADYEAIGVVSLLDQVSSRP